MGEDYKCTLTEASLERAKNELNEDPANRLGAVETLRAWIDQQKHISIITSTEYLLRYLRTAKFSQLRARELVEGNLTLRTNFPHYYQDVDPANPEHVFALTNGMIVPLPGFDKEGRKFILFRQGSMDKSLREKMIKDKKKRHDFFKGVLSLLLWLMDDENIQVNGFIYINDFTGYTMQHFQMMSLADIKDLMKFQGNSPGRFKGFWYYNTGSIFESLMEIVRPFMGQKFKDRLQILGSNLENLYKKIPMEMLPDEYLPDDYKGPSAGSLQSLIDSTVKAVQNPKVRDRIRYETDPKWGIDKSLKTTESASSFRKLNVD